MSATTMRDRRLLLAALVAMSLLFPGRAWSQAPQQTGETPKTQSYRVERTFNNAPFSYTMELKANRELYTVYTVKFPSPVESELPQNNVVPAEYYLPVGIAAGSAPRPAVICLHILGGGFELVQLFCGALAAKGIPAIMFQLPYYGERSPPGGRKVILDDARLFQNVLSQAIEDSRRTVDLLASRPEVDPAKIGIAGISMGGIMAGAAVGLEPRLRRVDLLLAGGDIPSIIQHSRETRGLHEMISLLPPDQAAKMRETLKRMDPLTHAEALSRLAKEGRVLMINAANDEVIPRACTQKLADAIGLGADRLVWLDGLGHYTAMAALGDAVERTVAFFAEDLPPSVTTPPAVSPLSAPSQDPSKSIVVILQQLSEMLFVPPSEGQCHLATIDVAIKIDGKSSYDGGLLFIRGWGDRFRLEGNVPQIGTLALGQGEYPWMAVPGKKLFAGTLGASGTQNPLIHASPQNVVRVRMLQGLVAAASLGALSFDKLFTVTRETAADGATDIVMRSPQNQKEKICLRLRPDGCTPEKAEFAMKNISGTVTFRQWRTRAVGEEELFAPPDDLPRQEVDQQDLYRVFAVAFNLLVERTEK